MKKLFVILLAAAMVVLPSCKNQKQVAEEQAAPEKSLKEQYILQELEINVNEMAEAVAQLKTPGFINVQDGKVTLSADEKMVKPDFLVNPEISKSFLTLEQKYRGLGILSIDKSFASIYDMDVTEYQNAIQKVVTEINDDAFNNFFESFSGDMTLAAKTLYQEEAAANRLPLYWNAMTAVGVEELYLLTQDPDKIMTFFDDETASDLSYRFILIHNGVSQLVEFYPEMAELNTILEPLYVINAINAEQLKEQVIELKGSIDSIRAYMLK